MFRKKRMEGVQNDHLKIKACHYRQHNYLMYCNDVLVRWLQWIDEYQLCSVSINFTNQKEMEDFQSIKDSDLLEWLKNNGHKDEMYEINRRHILCSLVTDYCHYMLESFVCASKMKPAVAYALLRKPLRDNLAYIEWLRVNPTEMIDKLLYADPNEYVLSKEQKKQHIEKICSEYQIDRQKGMFVFRYDKNADVSLEKIWNKANHIVTTQNYTKSDKGDLNFVFVDADKWEHLTSYYYSVVPLIMSYALELIVSMFEEFAGINDFTHVINKILLILHQAYGMGDEYFQDAKQNLEVDKCPMICPHCGKQFVLDDKNLEHLLNNKFKCKKCKVKVNSSNYIFDFENEKIDGVFDNLAQ